MSEKEVQLPEYLKEPSAWFFWVGAISIFNSILLLLHVDFGFVFGLGITGVLTILSFGNENQMNTFGYIIVSFIVSSLFMLITAGIQKGYKKLFYIGFGIYLFDMLLFIYIADFIEVLAHLVVLKVMYDYKQEEDL